MRRGITTRTDDGAAGTPGEDRPRRGGRHEDEFLMVLAHELRNPIASIGAAARLLRESDSGEQRRWAGEVIERQNAQLARLVEDLMDVSRLGRGNVRLKKERLELGDVIGRAVDAVRPLMDGRSHELTIAPSPGPMAVDGDPMRLEQVLVNLLANAAKYTDEGGRVQLKAERDGQDLVITVRDTGQGILPEMLPRVFEMFSQAERTLDRSQGGLGLGLAIVERLVALHGGSVSAASDGLGRGSEFTVRLPAAPPATAATPRDRPGGTEAGGRRRILVVDDNEDAASGLARLLGSCGHDVATAHDVAAALELARGHRPEVCLLDIALPGMTGYQLAERLRGDECGRDALFIAVSGYGRDEDRDPPSSGFHHHLVKPLDFDSLLALIARGR